MTGQLIQTVLSGAGMCEDNLFNIEDMPEGVAEFLTNGIDAEYGYKLDGVIYACTHEPLTRFKPIMYRPLTGCEIKIIEKGN